MYTVLSLPFVSWKKWTLYQLPGSLLNMLANLNLTISFVRDTIPILHMAFVRRNVSGSF